MQFWTRLRKRWALRQRYKAGDTPWDTGIVPPEIRALVDTDTLSAGRALDLGCGTGTNLVYLAKNGWQGVGVDLIDIPIERAREKAADAHVADRLTFHAGDVLKLRSLGITGSFTLITDIGCGHNLPDSYLPNYVEQIAHYLADDGIFMWYVHCPADVDDFGIPQVRLEAVIAPYFEIVHSTLGEDAAAESASAWYRLTKKPRL